MDEIRVVLVDDEPLVRSGLAAIVDSEPDLTVVGQCGDGSEAVPLVRRLRPDVVLMDVRMPGVDGIRATRLLTQLDGGGPAVLVVTTFENDDYVYDALRAGARGFLLKRARAEDFVSAIRTVQRSDSLLFPEAVRGLVAARGRRPDGTALQERLSEREQEILRLIASGSSNAEIASELYLSIETVKTHVRNLRAKLGARDRVQAVIIAYESGFVEM
ncbi:response regulator transcription factor [Flexivirga sp. B27]